MPCTNLFVYGTLRSGFRNPAYEYLARYFTLIGEGMVKGKFFDKGTNPVAVPTEGENYIIGELYRLRDPEEFSWAFEQLDDYEGLNTVEGKPPLYKRSLVNVNLPGQTAEAWIYWYNGDICGLPAIDTNDVMKYIQQKNIG